VVLLKSCGDATLVLGDSQARDGIKSEGRRPNAPGASRHRRQKARMSKANGARAVRGSQQPRMGKDGQICSALPLHSDVLRATDGSRSGGSVPTHPNASIFRISAFGLPSAFGLFKIGI